MKWIIILFCLLFSGTMSHAQVAAKGKAGIKATAAKKNLSEGMLNEQQIFEQLLKTKLTIDGKKINPTELKGKTILLSFQETKRNPSSLFYQKILPAMEAKFANLKVIIISKGKGEVEAMRAELKKAAIPEELRMTNILDNENATAFSAVDAYKVTQYPTTIHISESGKILGRYTGVSMDSIIQMSGRIQKAALSTKHQEDLDFIKATELQLKTYQSIADLNTKSQFLNKLDPKNPYTTNLKSKIFGDLALVYAKANNFLKANEQITNITDTKVRFESIFELTSMLADKNQVQKSLSFLQPAMEAVLSSASISGQINLTDINAYGKFAQLYVKLVPAKGNESSYIRYLKPIFETCKFFPADPHSQKDKPAPALETLLVYQYAKVLSNTSSADQVAKVWTSYLHAEPELALRTNEVLQEFAHVKDLAKQINAIKPTGSEANYQKLFKITLKPDINGKVWGLSGINSKYILLDFWGSWCGPCRASHPHLKELYSKYKNKGLEMIGIASEHSFDENMRNFTCKRAVEQDGTPWIQLVEITEERLSLAPLSSVSLVKKLIFDKEGKFYGIFEGKDAEGLDKKLAELLP